jgi:hypothetical protein
MASDKSIPHHEAKKEEGAIEAEYVDVEEQKS